MSDPPASREAAPDRATAQALAQAFLRALDDEQRRRVEAAALPDLGGCLAALIDGARAAYPELSVDPLALAATIGARLGDTADVADYLDGCRAGDLHLAAACARGDAAALALFERTFARDIDAVTRRFADPDHQPEDLRQILRERLFVARAPARGGGAAAPKIADYAGQGHLQNWLRITAVRAFLDLGKRKDRAREELADDRAVLAFPDPTDLELDFIKREYRAELARALRDAALALVPGDRHLLRQHLAGGMGIDQLAAVYGIHRATAARRVARAREQLMDGVRVRMLESLGLGDDELDSLMRVIASRLDVSITRLLASTAAVP